MPAHPRKDAGSVGGLYLDILLKVVSFDVSGGGSQHRCPASSG